MELKINSKGVKLVFRNLFFILSLYFNNIHINDPDISEIIIYVLILKMMEEERYSISKQRIFFESLVSLAKKILYNDQISHPIAPIQIVSFINPEPQNKTEGIKRMAIARSIFSFGYNL